MAEESNSPLTKKNLCHIIGSIIIISELSYFVSIVKVRKNLPTAEYNIT